MDRLTLLLASALLAAPCALSAQAVRGTLTGEDTGQPVAGAHVLLRDAQGRVVASTNTDATGGFLLRAPSAGSYTLLAERIGYVSSASPPLRLAADQTLEFALRAGPDRVSLEGIVVRAGGGRARCQTRPREGEQVQVVWNEARKALRSTAATAGEQAYRYGARVYDRRLDPKSGTVLSEQARPRAGMSGHPFTTVPLARLAEKGYVEADGDSLLFHAPDAQALLSEEFLDQHCFRLEEPRAGEEGLIGLAFEPVRGRRLPDIQGTLWLDRASSELRRMEYGYTGMESRRAAAEAGGEMEFRRLPGGDWIVTRWRIRMPVLGVQRIAVAQAMPGVENRRDQYTLLGIREEGGEVTSIATRSGAPVQVTAGARLAGTVYDSTRAAGLAGAEVVLVGTEHTARTDATGRYELAELPEGRYAVSFRGARLDSLGYAPAPVEVSLTRGGTTERDLAVPPRVRVLAAACGDSAGAGRGVLVGAVHRDGSAEPLPGLRVTLRAGDEERQARTDARGVYRFCGAPAGAEVALRVEAPGAAVRTSLSLGAEPVLQDFAVAAQPAATPAARAAAGRAAVAGRVVRGAERQPVAGAAVRVGSGAPQTTDAQGRFTLRGLSAGSHAVTVAHPEHGTRTARVEVEGSAADLELRLGEGAGLVAMLTVPYALDPLRVEGRPERASLAMSGFYARREAGRGYFLTDADFPRGARLSDALRRVPGIRLGRYAPIPLIARPIDPPLETRIASARTGPTLTMGPGRPNVCFIPVFRDGVQIITASWNDGQDADLIRMSDVVAVEIYRDSAEVPAQFAGADQGCGVIVMWTQAEPDPPGARR